MPDLQIEHWPVERLRPYGRNPRKNDPAVPRMVDALRQFGFRVPILAKSDGEIIDGHLRHKAALAMNLAEIPVIIADDMTEAQIRAFRIMINRSATWADWDNDLLLRELEALKLADFDLAATGFDERELDQLLMEMTEGDKDPDDVPETPEKPLSSPGELWLLGRHRLLCGDATSLADASRLLAGQQLDMVWTDPPYNVDYAAKNKRLNRSYKGARVQTPIRNDKLGNAQFGQFLLSAFKNYYACLKPGGPVYVAYASAQSLVFMDAFQKSGFYMQSSLCWVKNHIVIGQTDYQPQFEPILYGWKPGAAHKWHGGRKERNVRLSDISELTPMPDGSWQLVLHDRVLLLKGNDLAAQEVKGDVLRHPKPESSRLHPTMKPVGLIERMISNSSKPCCLVGDFFGGSGSTLMACERLDRCARLMELEPNYVDVIIRRWQEYTGLAATRESDGMAFNDLEARND